MMVMGWQQPIYNVFDHGACVALQLCPVLDIRVSSLFFWGGVGHSTLDRYLRLPSLLFGTPLSNDLATFGARNSPMILQNMRCRSISRTTLNLRLGLCLLRW